MSKLKWFSSRLAVVCAQTTEAKCLVDNEDVVGAAPTGDAPTTSELSTILLPTKVRLILETWRYVPTDKSLPEQGPFCECAQPMRDGFTL